MRAMELSLILLHLINADTPLTSLSPLPHNHPCTLVPIYLSPPHPHLALIPPSHRSPPLHPRTPPSLAHLHPVPIKGIHVIGAYNMVVEPESARRRADALEGGSVVLMAAPDQPEHKITLDFEKVVRLKTIKLQGRPQPESSYSDST